MPRTNPNRLHDLKQTRGIGGRPPLMALPEPNDDESDDTDTHSETLRAALLQAQAGRSSRVLLVDGDRCDTILIGAAATTPEDLLS